MADRMLLVGQERRDLEDLERVMGGEITVETAANSTEGLATIHLFGPFALVVAEMRMAGLTGLEFLARVRDLTPNAVTILLAGHRDRKRAEAAMEEGQISHCLTKPYKEEELRDVLHFGLAQYRANVQAGKIAKEARDRRMFAAAEPSQELAHTQK